LTVLVEIEPGDPRLQANIPGSIENAGRWIHVVRGTGTTIQVFDAFIKSINASIEARVAICLEFPMDRHRVYLWDNLNSHLAPLIAQTLYGHTGKCQFTSEHVRHTNQSVGQSNTRSVILYRSCKSSQGRIGTLQRWR
jgi:hypothetical protein